MTKETLRLLVRQIFYRVKGGHVKRSSFPAQEKLLRGVKLKANIEGKL